MARRPIGAVVTDRMDPEEVAEIVGVPLGAYVAHGNGYAVIDDTPLEVSESNSEAPTEDEDDSEAS